MVLLPSNQDLTAASGLVNMPFLEGIYHTMMDEMLVDMGGGINLVTLHLKPIEQQDNVTQALPAPQQFNPFFSRVPVPLANTRHSGTKITHRDVQYNAQVRTAPKEGNDKTGMGNLKANQIQLTVVKEALGHLNETLSFTVRGNRYTIDEIRVIGLSTPRYIMVIGTEINEQNSPDADTSINS